MKAGYATDSNDGATIWQYSAVNSDLVYEIGPQRINTEGMVRS